MLVVSTLVFTVGLAVFGIYMIEPKYKATAKILVRHNPQQQLILFKDMETPGPVSHLINPANNLLELATSRGMAVTVVRKFGLDRPKELKEPRDYIKYWIKETLKSPITLARKMGVLPEKTPNYLADAIDGLMRDIQDIRVRRDTEIIDLSIWGRTPELASAIANEIAELLVERTRDVTRGRAEDEYRFTKAQVDKAEKSLWEAEQRFEQYQVETSVFDVEQERRLLLLRFDALRLERGEAEVARKEAEVHLAEIVEQLGRQAPMIDSSSTLRANPVITELRVSRHKLGAELAALKTEHSTRHPEVGNLQARIDELSSRLRREPTMIGESETRVLNPVHQELLLQRVNAEVTLVGLRSKIGALQEESDRIQREIVRLSRQGPVYDRWLREKSTQEQRVKTLKTKLLELEVQRLSQKSDFDIRLIDPASVLPGAEPDYPDWEVALVLAAFVALVFAFGLPFLVEYFGDAMDTSKQVEESMGLPVLGVIPHLPRRLLAEEYAGCA